MRTAEFMVDAINFAYDDLSPHALARLEKMAERLLRKGGGPTHVEKAIDRLPTVERLAFRKVFFNVYSTRKLMYGDGLEPLRSSLGGILESPH